jgi:outer membrane protein assembly factor BamB
LIAGFALALFSNDRAFADDWPRWRGPQLNGISTETNWSSQWPKEGPQVVWKTAVGTGFASVSVSQGRLYTMGNDDDKDTVYCLDAATGIPLWKHTYDSDIGENSFEGGPTATPAVDDGWVYAASRWGDLFCFAAATGKIRWSKNIQKETGMRIPGWGFAGSPLVHENLLLLNVGDAGLAVEKATGKIAWRSEDKDAGYSTAVPFRRGEEWFALFGSGKSYVAVNVKTGQELWRFPWLTQFGVNAADPILKDDQVFISSGYGKGAVLLRFTNGQPAVVWQNREMRNQINSSVLVKGFLYGFDGDTGSRSVLKCLGFQTGIATWTEAGIASGALMAADGKLIILSDRGELIVADASSESFKPLARAQVLGGKCWTVPVLANGRIYCRNAAGDLVCVDVRPKL